MCCGINNDITKTKVERLSLLYYLTMASMQPEPERPKERESERTRTSGISGDPMDGDITSPGDDTPPRVRQGAELAKILRSELRDVHLEQRRSLAWSGLSALLAVAFGVGTILTMWTLSVTIQGFAPYAVLSLAILATAMGLLTLLSAAASFRVLRHTYSKLNDEIDQADPSKEVITW